MKTFPNEGIECIEEMCEYPNGVCKVKPFVAKNKPNTNNCCPSSCCSS